ncbi:response regulator transcription factor [Paraburkholderia fungorum]|nr:response regulator transcription factor [Paraburkholderia fungorum]
MNILFVDDDRERGELLSRNACRLGHISSVAYTRRAAVEYANTACFDVIVVNIAPQRGGPRSFGAGDPATRSLPAGSTGSGWSTPDNQTQSAPDSGDRWIDHPIEPRDIRKWL